MRQGNSPKMGDIGISVPVIIKVYHLQPYQLILFLEFSNFSGESMLLSTLHSLVQLHASIES